LSAVKAIAELAKEAVPESVITAYSAKNISFGRDYILSKPMDPRLLTRVAHLPQAKAAIKTGVSSIEINDWAKYVEDLDKRMGRLMRQLTCRNFDKYT